VFGHAEYQKRFSSSLFGIAVRFQNARAITLDAARGDLRQPPRMNLSANSQPAFAPGQLNQVENSCTRR